MKYLKTIHFFIFIFFVNVLLGQVGLQVEKVELSFPKHTNQILKSESPIFLNKKNKSVLPTDLRNHFLSDDTNTYDLSHFSQKNIMKKEVAFFCKIEAELEQSTKLPIRFRLGEVQAVDRKEGKWTQFQN